MSAARICVCISMALFGGCRQAWNRGEPYSARGLPLDCTRRSEPLFLSRSSRNSIAACPPTMRLVEIVGDRAKTLVWEMEPGITVHMLKHTSCRIPALPIPLLISIV